MKKIVSVLYVLVCLMVLFPARAYAYLDPSVMTYTVQIVAGVVIAVGTVIGILWRRAKKTVQNKLGIEKKK